MALDSDVSRADDNLHVDFYETTDGPYKGQVFVKIMIPGNDKLIIDTKAGEYHKRWRFCPSVARLSISECEIGGHWDLSRPVENRLPR